MQKENRYILFWIGLSTLALFMILSMGCTTAQKSEVVEIPKPIESIVPMVSPIPTTDSEIHLSWEDTTRPHPERYEWTKILLTEIKSNFASLDKAKDMSKFCPKYSTLRENQRVQVWGELFVWLAYYESGFDPKNADTDVGTEDDTATWSTGLWQVSAIDREAYSLQKIIPKYSFDDLKKVEPNTKLALALMARQINKYGLILLPSRSGLYWATLYPGGTYDESENIMERVQKLGICR